jgi:signal peptidase II
MNKTPVRLLLLAVFILLLDQVTKYIALSYLQVGAPIQVMGDFFRWTLTYNPGGAFGMRLGDSTYYLISSLVIFAVLVFYVVRNHRDLYISLPLTIVTGGAAGNIIDRIRFGRVVDFIDCEFIDINIGSYHLERWPIFNVADMAVSCGIITTIIMMYFHSRKLKHAPEENTIANERVTDRSD